MSEHPTTSNHGFARLNEGTFEDAWAPLINQEVIDYLEERVPIVDTSENIDSATYTPYTGALAYATDTGVLYEGDGSSWVETELNNRFNGGGGDANSTALPSSDIPNTEYAEQIVHVPSGKTFQLNQWSARTTVQTTPTGLDLVLYDFGADGEVRRANTAFEEGTPLESVSGETDLALRLENTTGGSIVASASFGYSLIDS